MAYSSEVEVPNSNKIFKKQLIYSLFSIGTFQSKKYGNKMISFPLKDKTLK